MKKKIKRQTRRHVTIRDVARAAGASVSTVSAALNNTDYVSKETRSRIRRAVARLRYRPNDLARSLRMRRSHALAVVVPDLSNSFYAEMVRGMGDHAQSFGYILLIGDSRESWNEERKILDAFNRRRVDGFVRIPAADDVSRQARALLEHIPVVYADRIPRTRTPRVACVSIDNVQAAYEACRYLIRLGHRRIAVITGPLSARSSADRLQGCRRALRETRILLPQSRVRVVDFQIASGTREAMDLLTARDRPTAIFCTNNTLTLGALVAIQQLKLRCPEEISLLGFDDSYWSTMVHPRLTMVRQPARDIGMTAARVLIDYIEERTPVFRDQLLPTQLMIRDSCAPPVVRPGPGPRREQ